MRSNPYQAAQSSEVPTQQSILSELPNQQSVLEETIIFFNQHIIQEKKELYKDVGEVEIKVFVSNVIKFAQKEKGVGNAGEDKWNTFCTEQKLSGNLYSFTNARRFSSAYSQIAKEKDIENKRLHQYSGDPLYPETFHLINAVSHFINVAKPIDGVGASLSAAADGVSHMADAFGSPVIHPAGEEVVSGAGDAVNAAAQFATSTFNGKNVAQATEVLGQAGNAATDVAPVDVAEVELAEATEGLVGSGIKTVSEVLQRGGDAMTSIGNKTVKLGGNGINTVSEMTPTVPEVMHRGVDVTSVGNQAAELGKDTVNAVSDTIDSGANCCEDTSWVELCTGAVNCCCGLLLGG